jgi:deazaflavin-dependent oxidoreductase (nitroreductase family)
MTASTLPRAKTLPAQRFVNLLMRAVLRTPLLSRLAGRRLLVLHVVGRKTGREYTIPVAYTAREGALLVGTPFAWVRNLRSGEPVEVRYRGRRRPAEVEVIADEAGVVRLYGEISRTNHAFAKFNQIGLDDSGEPDPSDLHLAWAAGARVVRLTVH